VVGAFYYSQERNVYYPCIWFSLYYFLYLKFSRWLELDRLLAEIHILYGLIHLPWLEYTDILILKQVGQNLNALVVIYGIKLSLYI
jgi:hypothetical protein